MDLRIGHLTFSTPPAAPPKPAADAPARATFSLPAFDTAEIASGVPAEPPPDLLREVAAAAARAEELWQQKRELHFAMDEDSGRVVVQVRDTEGHVIRTIPPSEALDVMSGKPI